ncbi:Rrg9 protein [Maudiozyma humilis]|uniref:Required for respiratory growth protein 9, mitochondrial n=1 Tax=Maudiozyma humilis TaxID=51915 RepID=A0AAV5S4V0_MAUHU|nr:Rrg9 protein [Kazachstania humilis]
MKERPSNKSARSVIDFLTTNTEKVGPKRENKVVPLWKKRDETIKNKIKGARWNPSKKLSQTAMDNVRLLKEQMPHLTSSDLAKHFEISPEAIRRILKNKFKRTEEESKRIQERWERRGKMIEELQSSGKLSQIDTNVIPVTRTLNLSYNNRQNFMELRQVKHSTPKNKNPSKMKTANRLALLSNVSKRTPK